MLQTASFKLFWDNHELVATQLETSFAFYAPAASIYLVFGLLLQKRPISSPRRRIQLLAEDNQSHHDQSFIISLPDADTVFEICQSFLDFESEAKKDITKLGAALWSISKDRDVALRQIKQLLLENPHYLNSFINFCETMLLSGLPNEVVENSEALLDAGNFHNSVLPIIELCRAYIHLGDFKAALRTLQSAFRTKNAWDALNIADLRESEFISTCAEELIDLSSHLDQRLLNESEYGSYQLETLLACSVKYRVANFQGEMLQNAPQFSF